jgi:hypothetical protein
MDNMSTLSPKGSVASFTAISKHSLNLDAAFLRTTSEDNALLGAEVGATWCVTGFGIFCFDCFTCDAAGVSRFTALWPPAQR